MRRDWHGLIKILEIQHVRNGEVIWEDKNLYNTLHTEGEGLLLECLFANDGDTLPPLYYLGLDNRTTIDAADTMADVLDEPASNGYLRQTVSSVDGWTISLHNGVHRALSQIVTFSASGGSWGPVQNLFMTDLSTNDGVLISTVPLSSPATLSDGDALNMRMALSLRDCPV